MRKINNDEFNNLIEKYISHPKVQELKMYAHHGSTRYDHSLKVAYDTYRVTKTLGLDYVSATKSAILHDFFLDEVETENGIARLQHHPSHAVENAKKYFGVTSKEEDIIKTHMFPVTFRPPKYVEGWVVDIVDDIVAIKERKYVAKKAYLSVRNFVLLLLVMITK